MIAQPLKAPRKIITRWLRGLAADKIRYCGAFKRYHREAVADVMKELQALDCLDAEDINRIWPVIADAAKCYHSVRWWPLYRRAIRKRYRMQTKIAFILLAVILALWFILPKPRTQNITELTILSSTSIAIVLLHVRDIFRSRFPYRYQTVTLMLGAVLALVAVAHFQTWWSRVPPLLKALFSSSSFVSPHVRRQIISAPTAGIIQLTLWVIAVIWIVGIGRRCINWNAKIAASGLSLGYGRPAEQCAELMIELLKISSFITDVLDRIHKDPIWLVLPSNSERNRINKDLNQLASHVRNSWQEAMRSCNGSAGLWIANHARRIEFFIRLQQSKNMLAGNNLVELRDSMAHALVQAADGDWHLIGAEAEEYSHAALTGRWKMITRRSIAIALPILGAVAATHFLRPPYVQAVVLTCLGFAGVQLLGLIDPDSPAQLDVAGRVASMFKRNTG